MTYFLSSVFDAVEALGLREKLRAEFSEGEVSVARHPKQPRIVVVFMNAGPLRGSFFVDVDETEKLSLVVQCRFDQTMKEMAELQPQ